MDAHNVKAISQYQTESTDSFVQVDKLREKLNKVLLKHLSAEKDNLETFYSKEQKFTNVVEKELNKNNDEVLQGCNKMDSLATDRMHSEQQFLAQVLQTVETFVHSTTNLQQQGLSQGTVEVQNIKSLVEQSEKADQKRSSTVQQFVSTSISSRL